MEWDGSGWPDGKPLKKKKTKKKKAAAHRRDFYRREAKAKESDGLDWLREKIAKRKMLDV